MHIEVAPRLGKFLSAQKTCAPNCLLDFVVRHKLGIWYLDGGEYMALYLCKALNIVSHQKHCLDAAAVLLCFELELNQIKPSVPYL